ncbi:HxlR-like helix-turn-helix [uncultured archaeon]|nr:HxlR-like helix-turn-helix [uncultured archaeon]
MNEMCTIYRTIDFISKKWALLILLELYKTPEKKRYSELKQNLLNITPKILSTRLRELQKQGLINKNIDTNSFPIKCEYTLTDSGKDFIRIIKDIKKWSLLWKNKNKECGQQDCKQCEL